MDTNQAVGTGARVLGPGDGEVAGAPESRTDRFMIDSADTAGRFSVVEHTLPPRVLAGPLHYHSREDEYSYVLEGRLGALLGDQESRRRGRGPGLQAPRPMAHLLEPWRHDHAGPGAHLAWRL